jgi:hypothetical protein
MCLSRQKKSLVEIVCGREEARRTPTLLWWRHNQVVCKDCYTIHVPHCHFTWCKVLTHPTQSPTYSKNRHYKASAINSTRISMAM